MRLLSFLLLNLFYASSIFANCSLVARGMNYEPYYFQAKDGSYSGLDIELIDALMGEANCQVKYKTIPWKRSLQLMKIGGLELLTGVSITPQRERYISFIGPMREELMVMLVPRSSDYAIATLDDIKHLDKPVGIANGLFYGDSFSVKYQHDKTFKQHIDLANSTLENLKKLQNHRLSAVIGDLYFMAHWIKSNNLTEVFKVHPYYINRNFVYFGLSRRNVLPHEMTVLKTANAKMQAAGTYQRIIDKYKL